MTEQELNKACEWLNNALVYNIREWSQNGETWKMVTRKIFLKHFRKAMTDKTSPLFEQALANVNPETRAEVRGNMEFLDTACEWLDNTLPDIEYITNASALRQNKKQFIDTFRKAMAVKESLTTEWHKVTEELPPVDTEVVCKMKGVPHTEHFVCKWDGKYWWRWNDCGREIKGWFGLNTGWEVVEWKEI